MNTTTTRRKVTKRSLAKVAFPPKAKKPYSRKELGDEVYALTGRVYDPTYLADCLAGTKKTPEDLVDRDILPKAVANLTKRAKKAQG
jgi:hypothetical protein